MKNADFPFENLKTKHLNVFELFLLFEVVVLSHQILQKLAQSWGIFWLIINDILAKSLL